MENNIKINDIVYHSCSLDILKFIVVGVRTYDKFTLYELKSLNRVGACGFIKVVINDRMNFMELLEADNMDYVDGLGDFIEGKYYINENASKRDYYEKQRLSVWAQMDRAKKDYERAKENYERLVKLIEDLNKLLK